MKIASIEAFPLVYEEANDHSGTRTVCLAKATTTDGATGWGEAVTVFPAAMRPTAIMIDELGALLVGTDVNPGAAWEKLTAASWWYGNGGIAAFAISAIDTAIWDVYGKTVGLPVTALLGGPVWDTLPALVSCHAARADIEQAAEEMASWVEQNQAVGIKVGFGKTGHAHLGFDHNRDVAFVAALRHALRDGPSIAIDCGYAVRWNENEAVRRTRAFEEHNLLWIEEPLGAHNPHGYRRLHDAVECLIAYGEREWTVSGIKTILESGSVDVIGIDAGRLEGITGFKKAVDLISTGTQQANAHAWAGPISFAAGLAVSFTTTACRQMEVQPLVNELHRDLADVQIRPSEGVFHPLSRPGLGVEIDEAAVKAHLAQ